MTKLNFNDRIRYIPQKPLKDLSQGLIEIKLEVQNPEYSGVNAYPYKYLPVMYIVSEKIRGGEEGVVIPKGTIVSLLTNQTSIEKGIPNPDASGTIPVYIDAVTGNIVYSPIDEAYYGYHESIVALLVPCNGGNASQIPYSSLDDQVEGWTKSTDSPLALGPNIPMGIVIEPIYQDTRGKYLNYEPKKDVYSTVVKGRFNIPYVDTSQLTFGSDADVSAGNDTAYAALWRENQFLYFDGSA
ncbi:MAG: hypothetical protein ACTSVB_07830, partial [Candidatus Heimdallarchaeaceae archaeon]